jgi:Rieske Fe-S protein
MAVCEVCGNDYDLAFEVHAQGAVHVFDSFECAIHEMAPVCEHCGCRVIGHGVQADGRFFCCAHCAQADGTGSELRDRADTGAGASPS